MPKLTEVPPNMLPCPKCGRMSLDYDLRPKIQCERTSLMGMVALEFKVEHLPVIFCVNPICDFIQWGEVDGAYAVFGRGHETE